MSDDDRAALRYFDDESLRAMTNVPKYLRDAIRAEQRLITETTPLSIPR